MFNPGDQIYAREILERLGQGHMGEVHKVRNTSCFNRPEAMEVMDLLHGFKDEEGSAFMARLANEIMVQGSFDHPHIATLYTALAQGHYLITFWESFQGVTMKQLFGDGPIPMDKALHYVRQILSALTYAHAQGVVHGALTLENIMLTSFDEAKLMHLGIAGVMDRYRITPAGVGSLFYTSTRQTVKRSTADDDIFSVGAVLYQLLLGRPVSECADCSLTDSHLLRTPKPPIELNPSIPSELNDFILICLAPKAQRFRSAPICTVAFETMCRSISAAGHPAKLPPAPAAGSRLSPELNVAPILGPKARFLTRYLLMTAAMLLLMVCQMRFPAGHPRAWAVDRHKPARASVLLVSDPNAPQWGWSPAGRADGISGSAPPARDFSRSPSRKELAQAVFPTTVPRRFKVPAPIENRHVDGPVLEMAPPLLIANPPPVIWSSLLSPIHLPPPPCLSTYAAERRRALRSAAGELFTCQGELRFKQGEEVFRLKLLAVVHENDEWLVDGQSAVHMDLKLADAALDVITKEIRAEVDSHRNSPRGPMQRWTLSRTRK